MELVSSALNAMYDLNLTRDDVIKLGIDILKNELEFNNNAGMGNETNEIPSFFRNEPSIPTDLKYTFLSEDLKGFWKRLENK
jgi:aldehyde:ferredoxin oxidoreductase